jgi:hypothetical protein
MVAATVKKPGN